ncbi:MULTISPECIES: heme biosynthesis HemY N-terminal domain-containing protein [unclassified Pseudoalteromonas]|uniref:heme biosynthesis HemY N-terminal domain-containing protein n=1 Tax=unclassified Pseudoalteromonas TaxID=194690 RepID=UPI00301422BE
MIANVVTFLLILVALAAGHLLIDEKGYVLIAFDNTTIEGTIVSFSILALLAVFGLLLLVKVLRFGWHSVMKTQGHFSRKRRLKAEQAWQESLWLLINDDIEQAANLLKSVPQPAERQDFVQAIAARAALQSGDVVRANTELEAISDQHQGQLASLWLAANNNEQALALLQQKVTVKKPSTAAISSYIKACIAAQQGQEAISTIAQWHKKLRWESQQWQSMFEQIFSQAPEQADELFAMLPKALQAKASTALYQVKLQQGDIAQLTGTLKKLLKQGQYHQLSSLLSHTTAADLSLKTAIQQQLKKTPEDQELLFALACLCNAEGDHELAAKIFDSLSAQPWQPRWSQQGQLAYQQTQQFEKAYLIAKSA